MPRILHLSDLHFGRTEPRLVDAAARATTALAPDLVVVSGDLTQRARQAEFAAAAAFLDRLPGPRIVVPGNHDVPLYDLAARLLRPLQAFRLMIEPDPMPVRVLPGGVVAAGLSSARGLTIEGGRLSRRQVAALAARYAEGPADALRILVTHHPVDLVATRGRWRARARHVAAPELAGLGVGLVLCGHLHLPGTSDAAAPLIVAAGAETAPPPGTPPPVLVAGAGTATSTRHRGETNSFNVIDIDRPHLGIALHLWDDAACAFVPGWRRGFRHDGSGWREAPHP